MLTYINVSMSFRLAHSWVNLDVQGQSIKAKYAASLRRYYL